MLLLSTLDVHDSASTGELEVGFVCTVDVTLKSTSGNWTVLKSLLTPGFSGEGQTCLSQSSLAQCKLLLFGTLIKHYSNTNRPPLLPQHMTDIYTAITDLLGKKQNCGPDVLYVTEHLSHVTPAERATN